MTIKEGIHYNLTDTEYFGFKYDENKKPVISRSLLGAFKEDPLSFQDKKFEATVSMHKGSLLDYMILSGYQMGKEIKVLDTKGINLKEIIEAEEAIKNNFEAIQTMDCKTFHGNNGKLKKAFEAEGKIVIKLETYNVALEKVEQEKAGIFFTPKDEYSIALTQKEKMEALDSYKELMANAQTQAIVVTNYKGYTEKCMIDIVPDKNGPYKDGLADLKTSNTVVGQKLRYKCYDFNYFLQAAMYLDMYNKVTGENRTEWYLPVSLNVEPYTARLFAFKPHNIMEAHQEYLDLREAFIQQHKAGKFEEWSNLAPIGI